MSIAEIAPNRDASLHMTLTSEEHEVVRQAAALENDGDMTGFIVRATIKAAKGVLATHESCSRMLRIGGK